VVNLVGHPFLGKGAAANLLAMVVKPSIRGQFRTDRRARAAYAEAAGIYRIVPRAVCLPADVADVVALARWAAERGVPLVPRGAGSAMPGNNVGDGVVVDFTGLEGPPPVVDTRTRRARMTAGASLGALDEAAARGGLRLPPDPSSWRWATAGGVVSTNAAGARSVRYGPVRPWVEAVEMVTGTGEVVRLRRDQAVPARSRPLPPVPALPGWPRVRKNSFGYAIDAYACSGDPLDLVIGAEGTLGLLTAVEWRLDPIPAVQGGIRILLDSYRELPELVAELRGLDVSALELLDRTFLDVVRSAQPNVPLPRAEAVLLIEVEAGDEAALRSTIEAAIRVARPRALGVDAGVSAAAAERIWELRHAASPILAGLPPERRSLQVIEDGCVPVERLGEYIETIREAAERTGIPVVLFGHAGDGNLHVNALLDVTSRGWRTRLASLYDEVSLAVVRLGGVPSGEHGAGRLRAGLMEKVYGGEVMTYFREVKRHFDPLGILNPGVILPSGEPPLKKLKVGSDAARLPKDIEAGLREIERTGGYATPRLRLADGR
jgi:FAD/FMN-containing dehydrogenase